MGIQSWLAGGKSPEPDDSFLEQVASEKKRTDAAITAASKQYEHELETRFADDV